MRYKVIVHEAEEGGYWAQAPSLPGCVSQGETLEEVKDNIKERLLRVTWKVRRKTLAAQIRRIGLFLWKCKIVKASCTFL